MNNFKAKWTRKCRTCSSIQILEDFRLVIQFDIELSSQLLVQKRLRIVLLIVVLIFYGFGEKGIDISRITDEQSRIQESR